MDLHTKKRLAGTHEHTIAKYITADCGGLKIGGW